MQMAVTALRVTLSRSRPGKEPFFPIERTILSPRKDSLFSSGVPYLPSEALLAFNTRSGEAEVSGGEKIGVLAGLL